MQRIMLYNNNIIRFALRFKYTKHCRSSKNSEEFAHNEISSHLEKTFNSTCVLLPESSFVSLLLFQYKIYLPICL
ncbi:hypothetical protein IX332_001830 [Porphyromonas levii]|nr:hypothetical protein [Porphyromonas levii]MBR8714113.1 hypothetical protein [Porphyromonas levii]MBR8716104.1 hypothetical protein [Porphyromonas levii]MBR8728642.1 hypothetical protein [Porphyromonas levii]MBR8730486.1 hypothetical protein [Porphyromonas levii]